MAGDRFHSRELAPATAKRKQACALQSERRGVSYFCMECGRATGGPLSFAGARSRNGKAQASLRTPKRPEDRGALQKQHNDMEASREKSMYRQWAHAPSHLFLPNSSYMVTAGTYQRAALFDTPQKRDFLLQSLFDEAERWHWQLHAWAVFANHYHFVGQVPDNGESLKRMIGSLHSKSAIWLNRKDRTPGRKVWFQYWDVCLTYERSYLVRLSYVHNNPVKHRLIDNAENYPWCSMSWFVRNASAGFRKTVLSLKYDRVGVKDDF
jgi:putative transposase